MSYTWRVCTVHFCPLATYNLGTLNSNHIIVTGQLGNKGGDSGGDNNNNNNNKRDLPAIDVRAAAAVVGNLPRHLTEAVQSGALAPSAKFRRMLQEA